MDKTVDNLIAEVENLFTQYLENGDKERAMKRLRVPPFEEKVPYYIHLTFLCTTFIYQFQFSSPKKANTMDNISTRSIHWNDMYSISGDNNTL